MNKQTSQLGILHTFREGEDELHTNPVFAEQYFIEREAQLVQKQQFLKIVALSFHNSLRKLYRNLLQKSELGNSGCCNFEQELQQMILDHESKLALCFDSDITKSLGLTTEHDNHLKQLIN
tara:strand:+ start:113 stop:475 length:363 start_codon:yes stop_codon:yes gene_type:complete